MTTIDLGDGLIVEAEAIDLAALEQDSRNARRRTPRNREAIAASLRAVGPARSLVVRGSRIVCGNGTQEAAVATGLTRAIRVKLPPGVVLVNDRSDMTEAQAVEAGVRDNRSAELAEWDVDQLEELAKEFRWSLDDLDFSFGTGQANDAGAAWSGLPEYKHEDKGAFRTIIVHFAKQGDVDAFSALIKQQLSEKTRFVWFPQQDEILYGRAG